MAGVLETLTIPRATASISAHIPRAALSSRSVKFSGFKGVKLNIAAAPVTNLGRRSTRIASEARGAAVEVAPVSDDSWQSLVLESDTPVLVEFWAPWCGPCRMIHPVIDELAKEYTGKLKCFKVNTDECPSTATRYGIRSIPTVMIFKDGEKKDAVIGAVPKSTLTTSIEKFL